MARSSGSRAPRISKEALLRSQAHYQESATRLAWFIRTLDPPAGFSFLASPRGYSELLVFVDYADGSANVVFYDLLLASAERCALESELWRAHQDGPHLASLLEALQDAQKYRAKEAARGAVGGAL